MDNCSIDTLIQIGKQLHTNFNSSALSTVHQNMNKIISIALRIRQAILAINNGLFMEQQGEDYGCLNQMIGFYREINSGNLFKLNENLTPNNASFWGGLKLILRTMGNNEKDKTIRELQIKIERINKEAESLYLQKQSLLNQFIQIDSQMKKLFQFLNTPSNLKFNTINQAIQYLIHRQTASNTTTKPTHMPTSKNKSVGKVTFNNLVQQNSRHKTSIQFLKKQNETLRKRVQQLETKINASEQITTKNYSSAGNIKRSFLEISRNMSGNHQQSLQRQLDEAINKNKDIQQAFKQKSKRLKTAEQKIKELEASIQKVLSSSQIDKIELQQLKKKRQQLEGQMDHIKKSEQRLKLQLSNKGKELQEIRRCLSIKEKQNKDMLINWKKKKEQREREKKEREKQKQGLLFDLNSLQQEIKKLKDSKNSRIQFEAQKFEIMNIKNQKQQLLRDNLKILQKKSQNEEKLRVLSNQLSQYEKKLQKIAKEYSFKSADLLALNEERRRATLDLFQKQKQLHLQQ